MAKFIFGFFCGVVVIAAAVYSYFASGMAPVATSASPLPFEATLAHLALKKAVARSMPHEVPIAASEENLIDGAKIYRTHCAVCHGLPGQPEFAIGKGEFPKPPQLFRGKGVSDDPPGETYWKVDNGIRLTGMPAFRQSLSDDQMWEVSLLLANSDKLSGEVKKVLEAPL